jgi:uncharacterized protein affecting Mg2+/Co2+ transport
LQQRENVRSFIRQVEPIMQELNNKNASEQEFYKVYNNFSEDIKLATRAYFIVDTSNVEKIETPLISPTADYRGTLTHPLKNPLGVLLGNYHHRIVVYSDGSKITSASRYAYGESKHIGFHYDGTEYLETQGGRGYKFFWSEVLGKFHSEIGGIKVNSSTVRSYWAMDYKGNPMY